jgi:hypothetical protein
LVLESSGSSIYHALASRVERRFSGGLSLLASYTYGHAIDDSSGGDDPIGQDARNLRAERGSSNFDARQRLAVSYVYQLPFGQGKRFGANLPAIADALLGAWQVSGIAVFQSGNPLTPAISGQQSQTGVTRDRPNATGIDPVFSDRSDSTVYLNPAAFVLPPSRSFGNAGRNSIVGPGISNVDLSLSKQFRYRDKLRAQFRTEFFNAFNHPQFAQPVALVNDLAFGRITSTRADNRQIQFGLKLDF